MIFSKRLELSKNYYEWLEKIKKEKNMNVKDDALAVITFLNNYNLLKEISVNFKDKGKNYE